MPQLETLIEGCLKGRRKEQHELYKRYSPVLLGICLRYVEDKAEAEDILQEGFLKIFENIQSYEGKGSFEGWMKSVMVNTAITHFHKNKKHYHHEEIEDFKEEIRLNGLPDADLDARELLKVINQMPQGYKMVFNLFAIEGYKHKEIAEKLNIDENTSKSQFLRAKQWLIKTLEKIEK
ncbi:MAG: sigma-70 family RNA polymerase sigma factor [Bacteroidales bacterium]|nr:sigma-70 family RNA polymerase sigma factor [Bacteroidales bacterium]